MMRRYKVGLTVLSMVLMIGTGAMGQAVNIDDLIHSTAESIHQEDFDQSEKRFRQAVKAAADAQERDAQVLNKVYQSVWQEYKNEGLALSKQGRLKQAERSFDKAVMVAEKFGNGDPRLVVSLFDLYTMYLGEGKLNAVAETKRRLIQSYEIMCPAQRLVLSRSISALQQSLPAVKGAQLSDQLDQLKIIGKVMDADLRIKKFDELNELLKQRLQSVQNCNGLGAGVKECLMKVYEDMLQLVVDVQSKVAMGTRMNTQDAKRIEAIEDTKATNYQVLGPIGYLFDRL